MLSASLVGHCLSDFGSFAVQDTKPLPILQVQVEAFEQTIEHDLRRSDVTTFVTSCSQMSFSGVKPTSRFAR